MSILTTDHFLVQRESKSFKVDGQTLFAAFASSSIVVGDTPPTDPDDNTLWWNSSNGRLYIYYADTDTSQWVEASPSSEIDETLFVSAKNNAHKEGDLTLGITESDVAIKLEVATGTIYAPNAVIEPIASERRLKENIVEIETETAWETVRDLPFYEYNFIGSEEKSYGPMADEVPEEMVTVTPNSDEVGPIHSFNNAMLHGRMFVALQEALKEIESLKEKVKSLEEK